MQDLIDWLREQGEDSVTVAVLNDCDREQLAIQPLNAPRRYVHTFDAWWAVQDAADLALRKADKKWHKGIYEDCAYLACAQLADALVEIERQDWVRRVTIEKLEQCVQGHIICISYDDWDVEIEYAPADDMLCKWDGDYEVRWYPPDEEREAVIERVESIMDIVAPWEREEA